MNFAFRQLLRYDLLLIGLIFSPFTVGSMFLLTMWGLLTVEVVPADQQNFPIPNPGEKVEVYGTWVQDRGHFLGDWGWNEIHPAFYIHNLSSGVEGGSVVCRLLENVHSPGRLQILDSIEPCKWARGKVEFVFTFSDGDIHLDLRLDPEYQYLANNSPPPIMVSYPMALVILPASVFAFGLSYAIVLLLRPKKTLIGRVLFRLFRV